MADKNDDQTEVQPDLTSPEELEGDLNPDTQSSSSQGVITPLSGNSGSTTDVSELSSLPSSTSLMSTTSLDGVSPLSGTSDKIAEFTTLSSLPSSSSLTSTSSLPEVIPLSSKSEDISDLSTLASSAPLVSASSLEVVPPSSNLEIASDVSELSTVASSHSLTSATSSVRELREGTPLSGHSESTSDISELSSLSEVSSKIESLSIHSEKPDSSSVSAEQSGSPAPTDLSIPLESIKRFSESGELKVDRHLFIFSEIRKIALNKVREKDLRDILKKFLSNVPTFDKKSQCLGKLEAKQTPSVESQTSGTQSANAPLDLTTGESSSDAEEKLIRAICGTPDSSSPDEQFLQDRLNTLADMLEQIEGLTSLIRDTNILGESDSDKSPGPSSRLTSAEAVPTIVQLFEEAQKSLESVGQWTNRLFNWCMTTNADIQEMREWLNEINSLSESSGFQTVRDRLAAWESSRSSIDHLGNATCLLVIEKEISELLQTLIAEIHIIQYKYWMDKGKETSRERGENGSSGH